MTVEDCLRFEGCEAPLCPMDKSLSHSIWYPDEAVCALKKFNMNKWVHRQKEMVKLKVPFETGFFSVKSLEGIKRLSPSIQGENPDTAALFFETPYIANEIKKGVVKTSAKRGK